MFQTLTGELHLPALPSIPASPASHPLNLAQMIGGGRSEQAGPLSVPGVEDVDRGPCSPRHSSHSTRRPFGARFIPAQRGGVPVAVRVPQRIVFEIH